MDRFPEILVCLLVALSGTSALDCYSSFEFSCSGNDDVCALVEQGMVQTDPVQNTCPAGINQCILTSTSAESQGVTLKVRIADCGTPQLNEQSSKCYGRKELKKLSPEMEKALEDEEKKQGTKYGEVELCLCDTDICNGVTRSAISLTVLAASLVVAMSTVFG